MVNAEKLCRRYGRKNALNDFTLEAGGGEIIGLVGPNGSGKTTVMKILATLLRPTSGRASICGYDVAGQPIEIRRVIGYVPEESAVWGGLSASENLYYWGRIRGLDRKGLVERIGELLGRLDIAAERGPVSGFSKGMRQRVAIGMAFMHSPRVILLDEPTSGLDPGGRLLLRGLIQDAASEGGTVILSTHEMLEASKVCTSVLFLRKGKVMGVGDPGKEDLEQKYMEFIS